MSTGRLLVLCCMLGMCSGFPVLQKLMDEGRLDKMCSLVGAMASQKVCDETALPPRRYGVEDGSGMRRFDSSKIDAGMCADDLTSSGAVNWVLFAIRIKSEHPETLSECCWALASLTAESSAARQEWHNVESQQLRPSPTVLLNVMNWFPGHVAVQRHCMMALRNLARGKGGYHDDALLHDAVHTATEAMRANAGNAGMQQLGCNVIFNFMNRLLEQQPSWTLELQIVGAVTPTLLREDWTPSADFAVRACLQTLSKVSCRVVSARHVTVAVAAAAARFRNSADIQFWANRLRNCV